MIRRNLSADDWRSKMKIGEFYSMFEWLKKKDKGNAFFFIRLRYTIYYIDIIKGKAVFEDIEITEEDNLSEFKERIELGTGDYTILCDLTIDDIYSRIKDFYNDVLETCLGKTLKEQDDYLFRNNAPNSNRPLKSGEIEKSEKYIRSLPDKSSITEQENLVKQIIYGDLEYAYHAKDGSGVKMHQYADALEKKIITSK